MIMIIVSVVIAVVKVVVSRVDCVYCPQVKLSMYHSLRHVSWPASVQHREYCHSSIRRLMHRQRTPNKSETQVTLWSNEFKHEKKPHSYLIARFSSFSKSTDLPHSPITARMVLIAVWSSSMYHTPPESAPHQKVLVPPSWCTSPTRYKVLHSG